MRTARLSPGDVKFIKSEKRFGTSVAVLILSLGVMFNFLYFITGGLMPAVVMILLDIAALGAAAAVYYGANRKHIKDLKDGEKRITTVKVSDKMYEASYEPGSGILYLPILGDIFPKLWGQKMKKVDTYYIVADNVKYRVSHEVFEGAETGTEVEMHRTRHGDNLLGFHLISHE